ncbi:hypothetical protein WKH57_01700 [Niallia taxi]|uniref:hypothetical protein n=1 Tax=Niallia taxi TaxID=2499688 RepID=UPI00318287D0
MEIEIGDKYKLTSDPMNVILEEKYEKKVKDGALSGEVDYKRIGFYKDIPSAALGLFRREVNLSNARTMNELVDLIKDTEANILNAFSK